MQYDIAINNHAYFKIHTFCKPRNSNL